MQSLIVSLNHGARHKVAFPLCLELTALYDNDGMQPPRQVLYYHAFSSAAHSSKTVRLLCPGLCKRALDNLDRLNRQGGVVVLTVNRWLV